MSEKSYSEFVTRPLANEGVKVSLLLPDGSKSDHWLKIRGADSDAYRHGQAELFRLNMQKIQTDGKIEESVKAFEEKHTEILASCIAGWSFDEELTCEEAIQFLKDAPKVRDTIEETIRDQNLFLKKKRKRSSNTVKSGSSSTAQSPEISKGSRIGSPKNSLVKRGVTR